jgi:very-short-patch-repair endonuclease
MRICKYCGKQFEDSEGLKFGGHITTCSSRPKDVIENRLSILRAKGKLQVMSAESRLKISIARKKYLLEHPDKVPYKLNHKHKQTYPERYFKKVLHGFVMQYMPEGTLYCIDFANIDNKIAIEIDGEQHYVDKKMVIHDIKRTKILEELGWRIIRVRWSYFKKLSNEQKREIIYDINSHSMDISTKLTNYVDIKKQIKRNAIKAKAVANEEKIINRIHLLTHSDIDFSKYGWIEEASKLVKISRTSIVKFIKKYMPELFATSHKSHK